MKTNHRKTRFAHALMVVFMTASMAVLAAATASGGIDWVVAGFKDKSSAPASHLILRSS